MQHDFGGCHEPPTELMTCCQGRLVLPRRAVRGSDQGHVASGRELHEQVCPLGSGRALRLRRFREEWNERRPSHEKCRSCHSRCVAKRGLRGEAAEDGRGRETQGEKRRDSHRGREPPVGGGGEELHNWASMSKSSSSGEGCGRMRKDARQPLGD